MSAKKNLSLNLSKEAMAIFDQSIELFEEEMPKVFKDDAQSLINATNVFLSNLNQIYPKIELYNSIQKKIHMLREMAEKDPLSSNFQDLIEEYKTYKIKEEEFNFFISQMDKFQASLNQYLGQNIQTVFLYNGPNGEIEIYKLIGDVSQAVKQDIASRGGGLSGRYSTANLEDRTVFEKMKIAQTESIEDNVTPTYKEVLERGIRSRKITKSNKMLILWKPHGIWRKFSVSGGAGDLGEAYLYFIMSEERMKMFIGDMENKDITTYLEDGVSLVDNLPGLIKGDFEANGVQIAAKTNNASMMGYKNTISFAKKISTLTPEKVAKLIANKVKELQKKEQQGKGRRNFEIAFTDTADDLLKDLISPMLK